MDDRLLLVDSVATEMNSLYVLEKKNLKKWCEDFEYW